MPVEILLAHVKPSQRPPELYHVVHHASFKSAPSVIHTGGRLVRVVLINEVGSPPYMWLVSRPMYGLILLFAASAAVTVFALAQLIVSQHAILTELKLAEFRVL